MVSKISKILLENSSGKAAELVSRLGTQNILAHTNTHPHPLSQFSDHLRNIGRKAADGPELKKKFSIPLKLTRTEACSQEMMPTKFGGPITYGSKDMKDFVEKLQWQSCRDKGRLGTQNIL